MLCTGRLAPGVRRAAAVIRRAASAQQAPFSAATPTVGLSGRVSVSAVSQGASCGAQVSPCGPASLPGAFGAGVMQVSHRPAGALGGVRHMFGQTFHVGTLEAYPREDTGSRRMGRARKKGLVPGVLYGRNADGTMAEPVLLYLESRDVAREIRERGETLENTLYDLTINGETVRVLPRQLHTHPFKPSVYRLNFIRYNPGQHPGARIRIPFKAMNEDRCPALKEGGWLLQLQYGLNVFANGETIPDFLMMDLRGKKTGSKVNVSEVFLNEGISLRTKQRQPKEFPVAKLIGSRRGAAADKA